MEDYIPISLLNDFFFCPYSIYLHNVYMDTDEGLYYAAPQIKGKIAHETVDNKTASNRKDIFLSLPVYSEKYRLMGKIDLYRCKDKMLVERKYQLKNIYQGLIYQLWAQMFCLREMGLEVKKLAFYDMSANRMIPVNIPTEDEERIFARFIESFRMFNPLDSIKVNYRKCTHCIYSSLCDKINEEDVYI